MTWSLDVELDAGAAAAMAAGKPVVWQSLPAVWPLPSLIARLTAGDEPGCRTTLLVPDPSIAAELADYLGSAIPDHLSIAARGLSRTSRLLQRPEAATLVASPTDALALVERSALKLHDVQRTVVVWPRFMAAPERLALDTVLGATPRTQRVIVSEALDFDRDLIERYAHRAPIGRLATMPASPGSGVRYAVVGPERLAMAVEAALDVLAPESAVLWDPHPRATGRWARFDSDPTVLVETSIATTAARATVAIATDLPSPHVLDQLRGRASRVVVLVRAHQVDALRQLADPVATLTLTTEADRARQAAVDLRERVRTAIGGRELHAELLTLASLFDEHDPALVAAALAAEGPRGPSTSPGLPSWVRLRMSLGRRDNVKPGDIVGALINAVGIPKDHVGRLELRDTFSVVDIRTPSAEAALRGLAEVKLRGRPLTPSVETK